MKMCFVYLWHDNETVHILFICFSGRWKIERDVMTRCRTGEKFTLIANEMSIILFMVLRTQAHVSVGFVCVHLHLCESLHLTLYFNKADRHRICLLMQNFVYSLFALLAVDFLFLVQIKRQFGWIAQEADKLKIQLIVTLSVRKYV